MADSCYGIPRRRHSLHFRRRFSTPTLSRSLSLATLRPVFIHRSNQERCPEKLPRSGKWAARTKRKGPPVEASWS
eukprot:749174-Pyramimonas_sp.AAC.1